MTLAELDQIDLLAEDPDGRVLAVAVAVDDWDDSDEQLLQLVEKLQFYADVITSGELARAYPATKGRPVSIRVDCFAPMTPRIADAVDHIRGRLTEADVGLEVQVHPSRG